MLERKEVRIDRGRLEMGLVGELKRCDFDAAGWGENVFFGWGGMGWDWCGGLLSVVN